MTTLILPIIIAFAVALIAGPVIIPMLRKLKLRQTEREDGPQSHLKKSGTPMMGGIIILLALIVSVLIMMGGYDPMVVIGGIAILGYGFIGFLDDYIKGVKKRSLGLRAWQKIVMQVAVSLAVALAAYNHVGTVIRIPFTAVTWDMGWLYIPFIMFVFVAATNGANLTDGLDGLLSGVSVIIFAALGLIAVYILDAPRYVVVLCGAMTGALLGFLRFNTHPAQVFMGDTGSMAIGAAIAFATLSMGLEFWIVIMGGMLVASTLSVIIQVGSFKLRGKRVFKMAPLHHHFELLGHKETWIVSMYMIATVILSLIGILAVRV